MLVPVVLTAFMRSEIPLTVTDSMPGEEDETARDQTRNAVAVEAILCRLPEA